MTKRIREATIGTDAHFPGIANGWGIEQLFYPTGWSWVSRQDEPDWVTGEVREVEVARPLIGWALIKNRESGEDAIVGITADPGTPHPYPAPQADGFAGYAQATAGTYLSDSEAADADDVM